MNKVPRDVPMITVLVEFLSAALGPHYEVVYYELQNDNTGRVAQVELMFMTGQQVGDPMPADITAILNKYNFESNAYITGLTAVYSGGRLANTGLLYMHDVPNTPRGVLSVSADSTTYFDMARRLLFMSNLDSKMSFPASPLELMDEQNLIHVQGPASALGEPEAEISMEDSCVQKIEEIVNGIMGPNSHEQPAFTQSKRLEIVEQLNLNEVFKVKGMLHTVARRIFCSDATVYRYLAYINGGK